MASIGRTYVERGLLRSSRCHSASSSSHGSFSSFATTSLSAARPSPLVSRRSHQVAIPARSGSSGTRHSPAGLSSVYGTPLRTPCRSLHTSTVRKAAAGSTKTVDYLLADVGEGITECEIVKWFVEPGSTVEEFDILVEVQSDKASVEITSRYAGRVKEHCYKVGEVAKVGSALCKIEVEVGEGEGEGTSEAGKEAQAEAAKDGVTAEPSKQADERSDSQDSSSTSEVGSSANITFSDGKGSTLATPAVRRVVREHGIDIDKVRGTGKAGRVTKEDVQEYMSSSQASSASSSSSSSSSSALPTLSDEDKTIPLAGTRKAMFKAMSTTWTIPHFGYSDEIDVTRLDAIRKEMQAALLSNSSRRPQTGGNESTPVKLTLLPFLLKALSLALYRHALFRSSLNEADMTLTERQRHCISIALSSPRGLLTPTLPGDVRQSSIVDLAEQIHTLQRISSERGLNQKEMGNGATVTLSNIGNIGGTFTFPLIPPTGQLLIGAIGRSRVLPRFDDKGDITKALILPVSFSADHRVVEGTELASFVQEWKELIEKPSSWLLQMR